MLVTAKALHWQSLVWSTHSKLQGAVCVYFVVFYLQIFSITCCVSFLHFWNCHSRTMEAGMQNALFMPPSQQCQCAGRTLVYGDSEKNKPLYMYLIDIQTYVDRHIWDVQKLNLFSITSLRCALVRCREAAHVHKSSVIWAICRAALFQH